jgi:hypothetical protein
LGIDAAPSLTNTWLSYGGEALSCVEKRVAIVELRPSSAANANASPSATTVPHQSRRNATLRCGTSVVVARTMNGSDGNDEGSFSAMSRSGATIRRHFGKAGLMLSIAGALGGCVAIWGSAYKIASENADSVAIRYDAHFISRGDVDKLAQTHCARFDRAAVAGAASTSVWGLTTVTFDCIARL